MEVGEVYVSPWLASSLVPLCMATVTISRLWVAQAETLLMGTWQRGVTRLVDFDVEVPDGVGDGVGACAG